MEHLDHVLSSDIGRQLLQQLPPDALAALLSSDRLAVASENSIIAAIDVWLSGPVAGNLAELDGRSAAVVNNSNSSSSSSDCSCTTDDDLDMDDSGSEEAGGNEDSSELGAMTTSNEKAGLQQLLEAENVAEYSDTDGYATSYSSSSSSLRNACCCSSCMQQQQPQPVKYVEPVTSGSHAAPASSSSSAASIGGLQQTLQLLIQQVRLPLCSGAFLAAAASQLPWICKALKELPDLKLMQQYYR